MLVQAIRTNKCSNNTLFKLASNLKIVYIEMTYRAGRIINVTNCVLIAWLHLTRVALKISNNENAIKLRRKKYVVNLWNSNQEFNIYQYVNTKINK